MNQQNKKQIIIMGALGALLVAVLFYQLVLAGGPTPPAGPPKPPAAAKTAPAGAGAPFPGAAAAPGAAAKSADGRPLTLEHTDVDVKVLLASLKQEPINYKEVRIQRDPMQPLVGKVSKQNPDGTVTDPNALPEEPAVGGELVPPKPDAKQQKIISVQGRRITAIVWDARDPVAVVDDEVVSVGYTYPDGVRVDAIEPSRVVFKVDDQQIPVEMKEK